MSLDLGTIESTRIALAHARHEIIMAWDPDADAHSNAEAAPHLMTALLELELSIGNLERVAKPASEIREMASALSSACGRPQ